MADKHIYRTGEMVKHVDGSVGMVERATGDRITVQFPGRWRSSVVAAKNLNPVPSGGVQATEEGAR